MRRTFRIEIPDEEYAYLATCARIRGIRVNALASRLVRAILKDQLVLSILNDNSRQKLKVGEWRPKQ